MTAKPTTYSGVAGVIAETLETHYGVDSEPLFRQAGLDPTAMSPVIFATQRSGCSNFISKRSNQTKFPPEVKQLLLRLLPSGQASQNTVAHKVNRSTSTLQRQLRAEGTNYREVFDGTRKSLATQYVRDGEYSLGEIAYQLGFTDQSHFS